MRQPGIEPGPLPWKGRILTIRPLTLSLPLLVPLVKGKPQRMRLNAIKLYNWVAAFLICVATIVTIRLAIECTKL